MEALTIPNRSITRVSEWRSAECGQPLGVQQPDVTCWERALTNPKFRGCEVHPLVFIMSLASICKPAGLKIPRSKEPAGVAEVNPSFCQSMWACSLSITRPMLHHLYRHPTHSTPLGPNRVGKFRQVAVQSRTLCRINVQPVGRAGRRPCQKTGNAISGFTRSPAA